MEEKKPSLRELFADDIEAARVSSFAAIRMWHRRNVQQKKRISNLQPRFAGVYSVPQTIREATDAALSVHQVEEKIDQLLAAIGDLDANTYVKFFTTILYLEEMEIERYVAKYSNKKCLLHIKDNFVLYNVDNDLSNTQFLNLGGQARVILEGEEYIGRIKKLNEKTVFIKMGPTFMKEYDFSPVDIEFQFNRLQFVRQHIAIENVFQTLGADFIMPSQIRETALQLDAELNDDGEMRIGGKKINWYNEQLNKYQRRAVVNVLQGRARSSPYIIFGPPGTGKTSTLIEMIVQIFDTVKDSRILVATPSNSGANLICELLLRARGFSEDELVRLHSFNSAVKANGQVADAIINHSVMLDTSTAGQYRDTDDDEDDAFEHNIKTKLTLAEVVPFRLVITTCSLIGCLQLRADAPVKYSHVVIDEAGQCSEPEALLPINFLNPTNGQVILAGDPKQLGPVVFSIPAKNRKLGRSFLGRILDLPIYQENIMNDEGEQTFDPRLATSLLYNYRSLPKILKLYNDMFYNSRLKPTVDELNSREAQFLRKLRDDDLVPSTENEQGVYFWNVRGRNLKTSGSHSWCNENEASAIFEIVIKLYRAHVPPSEIGIITPYKLQVQIIKAKFDCAELITPKIGSVEEFQGQERHVILLSTVRSCPPNIQRDTRHLLGFVQDPQRLNVAISRARSLLIIYGNANLLMREHNWRTVLLYCMHNRTALGEAMPTELKAALRAAAKNK